ncbi:MAG: hypothetical protein JWN99_2192 [Ilumatobacteraceae bacterium]|nr:hypothetical protein [Ilumatobacteraceae bacterium]
MIAGPFERWTAVPSTLSLVLFAIGWAAGWFALWRPRPVPRTPTSATRPAVAVIIPARDEAHIIGPLVETLVLQARAGDEVVVVDDHSSDATAEVARRCGARVIVAPPLLQGWAGKPHACHVGAMATTAQVVMFVDADVAPSASLVDDVCAVLTSSPDALVSVQPWHRPGRGASHVAEQLSVIFNVVALMGSGAFTAWGPRVAGRVAYGPVMACRRERYEASGGHAADDVRGAILEDIAIARRFEVRELFVGSPSSTSFRMYPLGLRSLIEGWTKGIAIGADAAPWWAAIATAGWVASVAGGWLVSCWFALATMLQLAVLARRAGRFSPWVVMLFPVPAALFVAVVARSAIARFGGRQVSWRGRRLRPDQETG